MHASSPEGMFAGRFRPAVNFDLSPGAACLQRSQYYRAAERCDLEGAEEFFLRSRDGNLLSSIEKFLQSDATVLYLSTNQSWRGLDLVPPRPVLDQVAEILAFAPEFADTLQPRMPFLEMQYILIHVRDADRGLQELDESDDELAFRARAIRFAEKVIDQNGGKLIVCISNNTRLRRIPCETHGLIDPGTSVQNTGFLGTLSEGELADMALIRSASQLYALSYFQWNSGFSVWVSRLFDVPAVFENARSDI